MISWTEFEKLTGSTQHNFEFLCRALIQLHYSRYGYFAALANQPGVEFHLHLKEKCALGSPGKWFGWQCRWYELPSGKALGKTRRKKIEESLAKTAKAIPALTDWILWTRHPLTKADQKWFYALKTKMRLTLWTATNAETLLSGDAEMLRRTYFGELLLTPASLADQHKVSVAPIRKRWLPEAHQTVDAERTIRRMLGEAESWGELTIVAHRILAAVNTIDKEPLALTKPLASLTSIFINAAKELAATLQEVQQLLKNGDQEFLRVRLDTRPRKISCDTAAAPRRMRGARLECGLIATNALADLKYGLELLNEVDRFLGTRMVAVLADAGGGKTQMAAEITAPLKDRPAGIFIRGYELHSGRTLDDLARTFTIQGNPVPSMEALLGALDAAGQRARRKLPLVIDGLNEAENPMDWKAPLSSLVILLNRFANVLVVCTVRTGARRPVAREWFSEESEEPPARLDFAKQALPDEVLQIEISGFGGETVDAIQKYFRHFLINPGDADLPLELLNHPLTLRIYCEVANPERKREVGIEAMPRSLIGLFEKKLDQAIERIGELAPRNRRYYEHDIRRVLDVIGTALWEDSTRELSEEQLRKTIGDDTRPWNESIIHLLEQEGVILLIPGESPGRRNIIAVYDALGGYLIANAILAKHGHSSFESWLKEQPTLEALNGDLTNCHPLAFDIFRSLVGLVPRRLQRQQLWQLLDEPLRSVALRMAATLEGRYLDALTITELSDHIRQASPASIIMFLRLFRMRASVGHPLNADFIDSVLRPMAVGDRDLHWTEWLRKNAANDFEFRRKFDVFGDIHDLKMRWEKSLCMRTPSDQLRAKWLMWLLPTTVRNLRDRVTRALYWFGRGDPGALFEMTVQSADINDPYIFERMLAASYGVAMADSCDPKFPDFCKTILQDFARKIFEQMFQVNAPCRTTHVLTREYGRRLIELASLHNRKLFSASELKRTHPPFLDGGRIMWQDVVANDEEIDGEESPFRIAFENYTLGRLAEGRRNYDFEHTGYRKIRAQVLWRIKQLGWTPDRFKAVERAIESGRHGYGQAEDEYHKVDRYGKKYSWIAFFELGGWLHDQGLLSGRDEFGRTWDVDIDPSFPNPTVEQQAISADFLGDPNLPLADWIKNGPTPDFKPFVRRRAIGDETGPWVALDGFVVQMDESRGRRLFAFARSFLVAKSEANAFADALRLQPLGGRWLPEKPRSIYTFAGEIPWCSTFRRNGPSLLRIVVNERKVKVKRRRSTLFFDGEQLSDEQVVATLRALRASQSPSEKEPSVAGESNVLQRLVRRDILVEADEIQQKFRNFQALIPVHDLGWEGRNVENVHIHGITLAKELAHHAGLVHLSQTHDLQTRHGARATYGTAFKPRDMNNGEQFFFIREDILRALLKKLDMSLVWAVWGERQLSDKQMKRAQPDGDLVGPFHGDFKAIIPFK